MKKVYFSLLAVLLTSCEGAGHKFMVAGADISGAAVNIIGGILWFCIALIVISFLIGLFRNN